MLDRCEASAAPDQELTDAVTAFMGGTVLAGMTCSALTAGVMALGLALGEMEDSYPRVARMIAMMATAGDAFADDVNAFNRVMNLGHEYHTGWRDAMDTVLCDWNLQMPGLKETSHVYLYAARAVDPATRQEYLQRAYTLGRDF